MSAQMSSDEQARASHPCDACGDLLRVLLGGDYRNPDPHCPVCQGSGRISDVMPAADAVADAAQLLTVWRGHFRGARFHKTGIYKAQEAGTSAESAMVYGGGWCNAADMARKAARAALGAVPGLRGDR
jgi:hypothetical protein